MDSPTLEGLLHQSMGGRVTVKPGKELRVHAGYAVGLTGRF